MTLLSKHYNYQNIKKSIIQPFNLLAIKQNFNGVINNK